MLYWSVMVLKLISILVDFLCTSGTYILVHIFRNHNQTAWLADLFVASIIMIIMKKSIFKKTNSNLLTFVWKKVSNVCCFWNHFLYTVTTVLASCVLKNFLTLFIVATHITNKDGSLWTTNSVPMAQHFKCLVA